MTSELKPSPKPGQYWARTDDTCLCYVEAFYPGDGLSTIELKIWDGIVRNGPEVVVLPVRTTLVWLWNEAHIDRALIPWKAKPGDVGIHLPTHQLFFIGPDTDRHLAQILSDWSADKWGLTEKTTRLFYAIPTPDSDGIELGTRLENPIV